jgi:hypothetical protein
MSGINWSIIIAALSLCLKILLSFVNIVTNYLYVGNEMFFHDAIKNTAIFFLIGSSAIQTMAWSFLLSKLSNR